MLREGQKGLPTYPEKSEQQYGGGGTSLSVTVIFPGVATYHFYVCRKHAMIVSLKTDRIKSLPCNKQKKACPLR
jgi:hypothetical protein